MSRQYDNTNKGALFLNDRKSAPNQPDYRGNIDVEGVEYWVSAWVKTTSRGDILSLSLTPKDSDAPPRSSNQNQSQARQLQPRNNNGWGMPPGGQTPPNSSGGQGQQSSNFDPNEPGFDSDVPF